MTTRPARQGARAASAKDDLPPLPPTLHWPLRYIVDGEGRDTGFCFLRGPVEAYSGAEPVLARLQEDHRLLGLTSMGPFPLYHQAYGPVPPRAVPTDGWARPAVAACEGWAHCFRSPDDYLPPEPPRVMISGSDFTDPEGVWKVATEDRRPGKRWDIVYSCLNNDFNEVQKNWDLAKACVARLAALKGLRILLAGRATASDVPLLPGVETCGVLTRGDFLQLLARARLVFFPNVMDASPRVITEALSLDIPVLVNQDILGGWKYVTPQTGRFFTDETDVVDAALDVLSGSYEPRAWYTENHGPQKTGARLAEFIREVAKRNGGRAPSFETARFAGSVPA